MTNRSMQPCIFPLKWLIDDHDSLHFLPFLYAELLFQLAKSFDSDPQELWMIPIEIAKLSNELVALSADEHC